MMTKKISILVIAVLLLLPLLLSSTTKAAYIECYCTFDNEPVVAQSGSFTNCLEMCGKTIGGQADCEGDCDNCCQDWCSRVNESSSRLQCEPSCKKTCNFKKTMLDIISMLYLTAGIIAVVMITFHGLRLIASKNPRMRETSKKGIIYVIMALIIIIIAGSLINLLMKGIVKPTSELKPIPSVKGCGGVILNVEHRIVGGDIDAFTKFKNNGDKVCNYMAILYGKERNEVGASPVVSVKANEIETVKISAKLSDPKLKGEYTVKLFLVKLVQAKEIDGWGPVEI